MESCTLLSPRCFSNHEDVSISGKIFNLLSTDTYHGEGKVAWPLAYTLRESPFCWVLSLLADIAHSFEHFCDLIEDTFYHFDPYHLDRKLLKQRKALHESFIDFWQRFHDLHFQAPRSQMKFYYLWDRFKYCLKKSTRPKITF